MATRGAAIPSRRSAASVSSSTRRTRASVTSDGTRSSATWVVTWVTRKAPCASISTVPVRWVSVASSSVWPG